MGDGPGRLGQAAKRGLDVVLATCALVALSPLLLIIAIAIRMAMGAPVLYRQMRPGLDERPFEILKFRSMTNADSSEAELQDQGARVTRLGRLLRRTSLDEVPELWNVLRGEMSIVGPRPLLMRYLDSYTPTQRRRHTVRPGITGLAQVNGRHELDWEAQFELDVWYVDNWSPRLDARIMLDTLRVVLQGQATPDPAGSPDFWFDEVVRRER